MRCTPRKRTALESQLFSDSFDFDFDFYMDEFDEDLKDADIAERELAHLFSLSYPGFGSIPMWHHVFAHSVND